MSNLRVRKAAEYVGLSKSLLDKLRCYGGGPVYAKLGTAVVYNTVDLDSWVAERRLVAANDNRIAARARAGVMSEVSTISITATPGFGDFKVWIFEANSHGALAFDEYHDARAFAAGKFAQGGIAVINDYVAGAGVAHQERGSDDPIRDPDAPWVQRYIHDDFATPAQRRRIEAEIAEARAKFGARSAEAEGATLR